MKFLKRIPIVFWVGVILVKLLAEECFRVIKRSIKTKKLLEQYPDEESRIQALQQMNLEERAKEEQRMKMIRLFHAMTLAQIDLFTAVCNQYNYPENSEITEKAHLSAPRDFESAKERVLLNARWLYQAGDKRVDKYISLMEPIRLDTYQNIDGWRTFLEELSTSLNALSE